MQISQYLSPNCSLAPCVVSCSLYGKLPPVVFTIKGKKYPVSSYSYVVNLNGTCFLGFQPSGSIGSVDWILGDVWIREYCQIYDMGNKRLGICNNLDKGYTTHSVEYTTKSMPTTSTTKPMKITTKPMKTTTSFGTSLTAYSSFLVILITNVVLRLIL